MNNLQPKTELFDSLEGSVMAASILSSSSSVKDAVLLGDLIRKLHSYRTQYPQYEKQICHAIFKIHDMAYYGHSDLMRQQAQVAAICGFTKTPTNNMSILKDVLDRIAMVKNPKNMLGSLQIISQHILETYANQNYQTKDENATIANRLKAVIMMLSEYSKTRTDKNWQHQNAQLLESVHPTFNKFSAEFPAPQPKHIHKKIQQESPEYAHAIIFYSQRGHCYCRIR